MYLHGDWAWQVERTRSGVQELVSSVNFAPPPPQRGLPCKHCHETFANEQGRGIHTRTMHPEHLTPLQYLEMTFLKIHQSLISKWAKEEDNLVKLAAPEVTKTLLATQQPKRWFP